MISDSWNGKDVEAIVVQSEIWYILKETEENHKNHCQGSHLSGRHLHLGPPKYEGVLIIELQNCPSFNTQ
jgi:hypothetical protein